MTCGIARVEPRRRGSTGKRSMERMMPTAIVSVRVVVEIVGICFGMSVDVALSTLRERGLTVCLRVRKKTWV